MNHHPHPLFLRLCLVIFVAVLLVASMMLWRGMGLP